jgi:DNA-binding NarL/FixJ family response regulator
MSGFTNPERIAPPVRVLLADDHQMVREGMKLLISLEQRFQVVGEAGDGASAVRLTLELAPDVLVLDYVLPGFDGAEVLRRVHGKLPNLRVLIVTGSLQRDSVRTALACGADAYVLKQSGSEELLAALNAVCDRVPYVSPAIAGAFEPAPSAAGDGHTGDAAPLTPREGQIVSMIAAGLGNREIAQRLCISLPTARKHRENLMRKLDLHNAAELTAFAIRQGWLAPG